MEAYRHSNSEVNQLKFVIRVMQVAALCISIFLAILSFVHLADLIYSASLVGVTAMMPTIFGTGLFLISLLFEGWLALDINKIGEHALDGRADDRPSGNRIQLARPQPLVLVHHHHRPVNLKKQKNPDRT